MREDFRPIFDAAVKAALDLWDTATAEQGDPDARPAITGQHNRSALRTTI